MVEASSSINRGEFPNPSLSPPPPFIEDFLIQECDGNKRDYLMMIEDIHGLLRNCKDLSNDQKLEYCTSERHYMKEYLKYALIKINKCFPD